MSEDTAAAAAWDAQMGPYERAYAANKRRTEEAKAQIADARAEPEDHGLAAGDYSLEERDVAKAFRGIDPTPPDTLTLSGAKLAAYRQLEAAAAAAHRAQDEMATTGVALREAIQALCAAIAPGKAG
jgi:hypothetical protein